MSLNLKSIINDIIPSFKHNVVMLCYDNLSRTYVCVMRQTFEVWIFHSHQDISSSIPGGRENSAHPVICVRGGRDILYIVSCYNHSYTKKSNDQMVLIRRNNLESSIVHKLLLKAQDKRAHDTCLMIAHFNGFVLIALSAP